MSYQQSYAQLMDNSDSKIQVEIGDMPNLNIKGIYYLYSTNLSGAGLQMRSVHRDTFPLKFEFVF